MVSGISTIFVFAKPFYLWCIQPDRAFWPSDMKFQVVNDFSVNFKTPGTQRLFSRVHASFWSLLLRLPISHSVGPSVGPSVRQSRFTFSYRKVI